MQGIANQLFRQCSAVGDHGILAAGFGNTSLLGFAMVSAVFPGDSGAMTEAVVIAEITTEIPSLTVEQAVMRMDLADLSALMFRNSSHSGLNMVYRRADGHIGWVDPRGNRGS